MIGRPRGAVTACAVALGILAGCGEDVVPIELVVVPNGGGNCGLDEAASVVEVTALAEIGSYSPEFLSTSLTEPQHLPGFPVDTRQLTLRVRDSAAALVAHGKTPPFAVADRPTRVPISLFPVEGTCPVGPMAHPRRRPTVVAVGDGALVIGGYTIDGGGAIVRVHDIEYFDPFTSSFTPLAPLGTVDGFNGGAIATLTDGRVVITGGEQGYYMLFDPATREAPRNPGVFEERALAAVVGVDDHRVLVAGGCADLAVDGTCMTAPLASMKLLDVDDGSVEPLTNLSHPRAGAIATLATDPDGTTVVVIAGGVDGAGSPATDVERIPITSPGAATVTTGATGGLAAVLDTGAVLTALAPPGSPPSDVASISVPGQAVARAIAAAPRQRRDAVMVPLEDGTVLAIGGVDGPMPDDPAGQMMLYRPTQGWRTVGPVPTPALLDHAAARLSDGSVLIVGGRDRDTGAELVTAWRYRPPLLGPFAATARVTPAADVDDQLVPFDPGAIDRADDKFAILATGGLDNYALIAGPRLTDATLTAVIAPAGGVGLIARATAPFSFLRAVLVPGQPARLERWIDGRSTVACTATATVPALPGALTVTMTIDGDRTVVQREGAPDPDLDCRYTEDLAAPGLWGIGAVGDGARVEVTTISVDR